MTKKKDTFELVKQHFYEDGNDIHWWINDDEVEDFLVSWGEDNPDLEKTDERTLRGKEYNDWIVGNVYGDCEGEFVDEKCPICGHFTVVPMGHEEYFTEKERFCSNLDCDWVNSEMTAYEESRRLEWERPKDSKPEVKLRVAGETIFEFVKRVKLDMRTKDNVFIKDDNFWSECIVCKRQVPASDFYISKGSGFAVVHFSHDDCTNKGPSIGVPFTQETKKEWGSLVSGLIDTMGGNTPPDDIA